MLLAIFKRIIDKVFFLLFLCVRVFMCCLIQIISLHFNKRLRQIFFLKTFKSNNNMKTDLFCCFFFFLSFFFALNDTKVAVYYIILPHVNVYTHTDLSSTRACTNTHRNLHAHNKLKRYKYTYTHNLYVHSFRTYKYAEANITFNLVT